MQLTLVVLGAAVPILVGGLVLRWRPRHPVGWLLVAHGISFFAVLTFDEPRTSRAGRVADQFGMGTWVLLFLWLVVIAYLLPDGRTANRFWRWWLRAGLVGVAVFVVGAAGDREGFAETHDGAALPVPWLPEPWSGLLGLTGLVLVALLFFGGFGAVWWRLRRARGDERLQLLWLVWGALTVPVTLLAGWVNHFLLDDGPLFTVALALVAVGLPATAGIAILRHRLFDIRIVLSRTLTYLLLVIGVFVVYATLLLATDRLGGLLAVGVVAIAVHPAYSFLRRRIEQWVYGLRADPGAAIRLLADRVEAADPDGLVAAVTDAVTVALRVERVWVETAPGSPKRRCGPGWSTAASMSATSRSRSHPTVRSWRPISIWCGTSPGMPRSWCAPSSSTTSCGSRAPASSPVARKSAAGCGATCTTASARPSPPSC
ncbi:hypothetical protein [Dactylosporangium cerinum]